VTLSVAELLKNDYRTAQRLLHQDVLPTTRVLERLRTLLIEYGTENDEELARVFLGLLDTDVAPAAYRWLTLGPKVSDEDRHLMGLQRRLDTDELAVTTCRVISRVCEAAGVRWVILLDQFEHLMRYEQVRGTEHIQEFFKAFVTVMADGHGVIVAGHYSGWTVKEDFYGRFLQPPIAIHRLTVEEIHGFICASLAKHAALLDDQGPGTDASRTGVGQRAMSATICWTSSADRFIKEGRSLTNSYKSRLAATLASCGQAFLNASTAWSCDPSVAWT